MKTQKKLIPANKIKKFLGKFCLILLLFSPIPLILGVIFIENEIISNIFFTICIISINLGIWTTFYLGYLRYIYVVIIPNKIIGSKKYYYKIDLFILYTLDIILFFIFFLGMFFSESYIKYNIFWMELSQIFIFAWMFMGTYQTPVRFIFYILKKKNFPVKNSDIFYIQLTCFLIIGGIFCYIFYLKTIFEIYRWVAELIVFAMLPLGIDFVRRGREDKNEIN